MNNIKYYRLRKGLSRSQLADKVGVTEKAVGNYETGAREPRMDTAKKLANELDTTIDSLFFNEQGGK